MLSSPFLRQRLERFPGEDWKYSRTPRFLIGQFFGKKTITHGDCVLAAHLIGSGFSTVVYDVDNHMGKADVLHEWAKVRARVAECLRAQSKIVYVLEEGKEPEYDAEMKKLIAEGKAHRSWIGGVVGRPGLRYKLRKQCHNTSGLYLPPCLPPSAPHSKSIWEVVLRSEVLFSLSKDMTGAPNIDQICPAKVTPAMALSLMQDMAEAIQSEHDRDVVHGDVKPGNLLLQEENGVLVGRLNDKEHFSLEYADRVGCTPVLCDDYFYHADEKRPEFSSQRIPAYDIFSLGLSFTAMLAKFFPQDAFRHFDANVLICGAFYYTEVNRPGPETIEESLMSMIADRTKNFPKTGKLLSAMLARNPKNRPTIAQVIARLREVKSELL